MSDLLPFIISGLAAGAVYGLAGTGLVLTYKTTGLFNFGYGAMATAAAYVFYFLHVDKGVGWEISFVLSVLVLGPVMGLLMEPLARSLAVQPLAYKVVGTLGVLVAIQGIATIKYGTDPIAVAQYLPKGNETFRFAGVHVGYDQLTIAVTAVLIVGALYYVFRVTQIGTLMRAVVDDPGLLDVEGTNPVRVRRVAWVAGSTLAALSGVLILPLIGLDPIGLTLIVVLAFGAAAVGAFSSIPLTFLGGLLIGVGSDVSRKFVLQIDWLSGLPGGLPFIVLFLALLLLPRRKLVPPSMLEKRLPANYHAPPLARGLAGAVVLALLALVPLFAGTKLASFTMGLSLMIVLLSLGLLVKTSGQISLCHAAFMAIGACMFSRLAVNWGIPWFPALLLAGLIVVPFGAIVAIPAMRLSGLFLALATFAFGVMVEQFMFPLGFMFGKVSSGREVPRPAIATGDTAFYYLVLAIVVITALVMVAIHHGRLGRILRGVSESPLAMSTFGLSANVTRTIVFAISSFFAAIGGILYAATFHFASTSDPRFMWLFSLLLLVTLMIMPFREPWYVVPSAIGVALPQFWNSANSQYWLYVLTGVFAILTAVSGGPPVMPESWRRWITRTFTRGGGPEPAVATGSGVATVPAPVPTNGGAPTPIGLAPGEKDGLKLADLTVRFGGLLAVDGLSMGVRMGQITGLIGPNGAGKTTTFNACSGLNQPTRGQIWLHGADVSKMSPGARARRGLGRTFQKVELCDALTVAENIALGREAGQAGSRPWRHLVASRRDHRATQNATREALELCGLEHLTDARAGDLSTGERRLVELARCLAGPFDVLLLDEPSSGLDRAETDRFAELLEWIVERRGCAVLLVEHDVSLVMRVCSHVYVLDFGELLWEGEPAAVAASPLVQAAYLGEPSAELAGAETHALAAQEDVR